MGSIVGIEDSGNFALYGNVGKVKGFTCSLGSGKSGLGVVDELLCGAVTAYTKNDVTTY